MRTNRENIVAGTVEEMIVKHGMGIAAFKHFRYLINQIVPFKQEIISAMLENYLYKREELSLLIPELGMIEGADDRDEGLNSSYPKNVSNKKIIKRKN